MKKITLVHVRGKSFDIFCDEGDIIEAVTMLQSASCIQSFYLQDYTAYSISGSVRHCVCHHDDFVGSPGDTSPPECTAGEFGGACEKCVAVGRGFRYVAKEFPISTEAWHRVCSLMSNMLAVKQYAWGLEVVGNEFKISSFSKGKLTVRSNRPTLLIGPYVFDLLARKVTRNGLG